MTKANILIVEDESIVAMEIRNYIKRLGFYGVDYCSNANDALEIASKKPIGIIIMDICLKGDIDGIDTAEQLRNSYPNIEIIFLTAHLDDYNVDRAIEIDPVAYLSKPFHREELKVALKIALKRLKNITSIRNKLKNRTILDYEFSYDAHNNILYCYDEITPLTKKENELLKLFIEHKNSIVDFYTIENTIWSEKEVNINAIRTLVKRLRQKLKHKFIESVSTRGYRLNIENELHTYKELIEQ